MNTPNRNLKKGDFVYYVGRLGMVQLIENGKIKEIKMPDSTVYTNIPLDQILEITDEDGVIDRSRFIKEETMNPEKEASKCQEESFAEQARRIAKEEIDKALKDFKWRIDDSGAEPQPQLTQKENNILKGLHYLGWSWIARDEDGELCAYEVKPERKKTHVMRTPNPVGIWANPDDDEGREKEILEIEEASAPLFEKNDFQFITWQDEPMRIAGLIDWGDEA